MIEPERRKDPTSRVTAEGLYALGQDVRYVRDVCEKVRADATVIAQQLKTGETLFTKIDTTLYSDGGMLTRVTKIEALYETLVDDVKAIRNDIRRVVWIVLTAVIVAILGLVIVRTTPQVTSGNDVERAAVVTGP